MLTQSQGVTTVSRARRTSTLIGAATDDSQMPMVRSQRSQTVVDVPLRGDVAEPITATRAAPPPPGAATLTTTSAAAAATATTGSGLFVPPSVSATVSAAQVTSLDGRVRSSRPKSTTPIVAQGRRAARALVARMAAADSCPESHAEGARTFNARLCCICKDLTFVRNVGAQLAEAEERNADLARENQELCRIAHRRRRVDVARSLSDVFRCSASTAVVVVAVGERWWRRRRHSRCAGSLWALSLARSSSKQTRKGNYNGQIALKAGTAEKLVDALCVLRNRWSFLLTTDSFVVCKQVQPGATKQQRIHQCAIADVCFAFFSDIFCFCSAFSSFIARGAIVSLCLIRFFLVLRGFLLKVLQLNVVLLHNKIERAFLSIANAEKATDHVVDESRRQTVQLICNVLKKVRISSTHLRLCFDFDVS